MATKAPRNFLVVWLGSEAFGTNWATSEAGHSGLFLAVFSGPMVRAFRAESLLWFRENPGRSFFLTLFGKSIWLVWANPQQVVDNYCTVLGMLFFSCYVVSLGVLPTGGPSKAMVDHQTKRNLSDPRDGQTCGS